MDPEIARWEYAYACAPSTLGICLVLTGSFLVSSLGLLRRKRLHHTVGRASVAG